MPRQRDTSDSALVDSLIHQAPVGLAFLGPDLRFRRVNAALGQIIGKPEADHADKLPSEVWPEDLAARAEAAVRKVLADGLPVTESGYPQGCTASWFAVPDPDGEDRRRGAGAALRAPGPRPRRRSGAARSATARWSRPVPRWSGWPAPTAR